MIYNRLFCSACAAYKVHYFQEEEKKFLCIANHVDDVTRPWSMQRGMYQKWLAGLSTRELIDVMDDLNRMIEYRYKIETDKTEKDEFKEIMKGVK